MGERKSFDGVSTEYVGWGLKIKRWLLAAILAGKGGAEYLGWGARRT